MKPSPIVIEHLNHYYGEGELRRQILFDVTTEIHPGEIILLTGPSGSGKTTLLTLVGALRTAQEGNLRVLGRELVDADESILTDVRMCIGYIFQAHNLLDALTAQQNVQMALQIHPELQSKQHGQIAATALEAVGLKNKLYAHPGELSGGERQRVAIARALAGQPDIILADEPTASLDKNTGREIVELLQQLAREKSVTVILVTHDNRILDIADRILTLEDGHLSSLMSTVTTDTQHMMRMLAQEIRKGELIRRIAQMGREQFIELFHQITDETKRMLEIVELLQGDAFQSMHEQVIGALTIKVGEILGAERATLYFLDTDADEFWTHKKEANGVFHEVRIPADRGIAGKLAKTGESLNISNTRRDPRYDPLVDGESTRNLIGMPVTDSTGAVFAVIELINKHGAESFDSADERQLKEFTAALGFILESWWRMGCTCRSAAVHYRQASACPVC